MQGLRRSLFAVRRQDGIGKVLRHFDDDVLAVLPQDEEGKVRGVQEREGLAKL